ncbi:hypothetical protein ACFFV7_03315 [Nonomuraea spiralis]|uniref:Uncharacterized protein n=1 Tax=Nonomuraea spiralis TaxID=46182 RepID=A0ABV5I7A3_9ACTN|nr:hypothetical protein [Nonomuraea spiralis]GGS66667.1 hypothetical protein GCM10010176_006640 [Nonomuraea spiralis]
MPSFGRSLAVVLVSGLAACSAPGAAPPAGVTAAAAPVAAVSRPPLVRPVRSDCSRAGARDFDGDGRDDIALGYLGTTGQVDVLVAGKVIRVPTPPGNRMKGFGWSVTMARVNDDRCADLVVGTRTLTVAGRKGAGAVYVLHGGAAAPPRRLVSPRPQEDAAFGESVAAYGDLVAIGAPGERPGGAVYLFRKGSFVRRITQDTPGVPGNSEVADRFGDRLALGPLAGGGVGLAVVAPEDHDDGPGRQDVGSRDDAPLGAVTVLRDVTAARLAGVRLPPPEDEGGRPCTGFGDSLVYVPRTGLAVFTPQCGRLRFYDLTLDPIRTVTTLRSPWDADLAASADGRVAALGSDPNDPALLLLSPKDPAADRRLAGDYLAHTVQRGIAFSGGRIVIPLEGAADVAVVDPATGKADLVKTATGDLFVKAVAG